MSFQLRPAKKMTARPEAITSSVVPRSGCSRMSAMGTASRPPATMKSVALSWPSRRWNHQASIMGMAIFMISLGWITVTPMSSQRCAPFRMTPANSTPSSRATPTR